MSSDCTKLNFNKSLVICDLKLQVIKSQSQLTIIGCLRAGTTGII